MKAMFVLLLFLVLGTIEGVAQLGNPILRYKESGYTTDDVLRYALSSSSSQNVDYRSEMVRLLNNGLTAAHENLVVTENNLKWALCHGKSEHVDIDHGFWNSRIFNGKFEVYWDEKGFHGDAFVFRYGKCVLILYKTICINLIHDDECRMITQEEPIQVPIPKEPEYVPPSVPLKNLGYSQSIIINNTPEVYVVPTFTMPKQPKQKVRRRGPWGWIIAGAAATILGTVYMLTHQGHSTSSTSVGGPGGAPITPPNDNGGGGSGGSTGGPGGANTTP